MSITLRVYNNGDQSCIVWRTEAAIKDCRGFALYRKLNGNQDVLHNWVGFDPAASGVSEPSTQWPFQRYLWWDYLLNADDEISYRVVPMLGPKDKLEAAPDGQCSAWTEPEKVTAQRSPHISAFFNRGIVATQWVARALAEIPGKASQHAKMTDVISETGNALRERLSGHLRTEILQLLQDAPRACFRRAVRTK